MRQYNIYVCVTLKSIYFWSYKKSVAKFGQNELYSSRILTQIAECQAC